MSVSIAALPSDGLTRTLVGLLPELGRIARRWCGDPALAEDLAQETACRALAARASFREGSSARPWLVTILHNTWVSYLRRRRTEVALPPELAAPPSTPRDGRLVARALLELPAAQREVLVLVDLDEASYAEAARALGVPVGTVMSRLHRARRALRAHLEEPRNLPSGRPSGTLAR